MGDLTELRRQWESALADFEALVASRGVDKWTWYRALAAVKGENCRRNDDTSCDVELAADGALKAAHDEYIRRLHVFYRARDGEGGVLGGRC